MISIQNIASALDAKVLAFQGHIKVDGLCSDSRADCTGKLFVAIPGDNYDGHDYVVAAQQAGAAALLVNKPVKSPLPQIVVGNIMQAMATCARVWRDEYAIPLVAITGSAGKTTVKEMLGAVLNAQFGEGVVTFGNLNNEIGVPLTLSRLNAEHKFAVIEMGMNHSGEIARLSQMARPDFALINNASAAHLEGVGTVEDVARAKGEIVQGLVESGVLFVNADDQHANMWLDSLQQRQQHRSVTFGLSLDAEVRCDYSVQQRNTIMQVVAFECQFEVVLPLLGEHNVRNALAVIAVALTMGVSESNIVETLAKFTPPHNRAGRYELVSSNNECQVFLIDDTYNANLASMRAALSTLQIELSIAKNGGAEHGTESRVNSSVKGIAVLGDIGELGEQASNIHHQIGAYAREQNVDELWVIGEFSQNYIEGFMGGKIFTNKDKLIEQLIQRIEHVKEQNEKCAILIKGSRFTKMEQVVEALKAHFQFELPKSKNNSSRGTSVVI